jgi:hypothetical protein
MKKIRKYDLLGAIIIFTASLSILTSQAAFATIRNSVELPKGIWAINADGEKGDLNIMSVSPDGQITGKLTIRGSGSPPPPTETSNIFGFWDSDAWKIMFLKENEVTFTPPGHVLSCNVVDASGHACHHRDQIFTGYMFGGLPCAFPKDPGCLSIGKPLYMAGSLEAFGGTTGTGAIADRSVFGWFASYTNQNLTQVTPLPCNCTGTQSPVAK